MTRVVPCLLACLFGPHQCPAEEPLLLQVPACRAGGAGRNVLECYAPQPGDLILFSYRKPLRTMIWLLGQSPGASHSAMVVRRPNGSLALLEARGPSSGVMLSDLPSRFRSYYGRICVRRLLTPLSPEQSARLTAFACAQDGKPFSTTAMLAVLWGGPVRRPRRGCAGPEELDPSAWFCSQLTAAAGVAAGIIDPCVSRPKTTDPEDLKSDRRLDLSACWAQPQRYQRCGDRLPGWWSESCCGRRAYWED
jgi:hypothetical protein